MKEKTQTKEDKFDFAESLKSLGFIKDDLEYIWFRPRDGFSIKTMRANNGKEMFTLMNFKRTSNKHIATIEAPMTNEEFVIIMNRLGVI